MQRRYSPDHVGKIYGVTKQTVIGWCEDGTMPAVNVARASATRKRYRMSEDDMEIFNNRRQNKLPETSAKQASRRTIAKPTKDFFANEHATETSAKTSQSRNIQRPKKDFFATNGGPK